MENKDNFGIVQNETLVEYIREFNDDVKLTNINLREKSLMSSSIWAKWLQYLYKEKDNLSRISELKQKVLAKKMGSVRNADSVLRMKSESRIQENDETMKKLSALSKNTQTNIEYIERALNVLQNFGFTIKNAIDAWKLNYEH